MLKSLLKASIRKYTPPENKEVALLLSGGVDSISIGICLEELGYKVHTYTFYLKDNYSYDTRDKKIYC